MKRIAKVLCLVCIVAMLAILAAGCGQKTPTGNTSSQNTDDVTKPVDKPESITMRFSWWGSDIRHKATLDAIAAYNKLYPHITIEGEYGGYDGYQQKLMTQLAGGSAPDLIQTDPIWNAQLGAQKENFVDLAKESEIDMTQFEEEVIKGFCEVNGIVLGLPMGINGFGVQVNKAFMERFNIPLDTRWTYEKIIEVGRKVHEQDSECYLYIEDLTGLQVKFMCDYTRSKYGKYWINDDYKVHITKDELAEQFKVMKELFDSGAAVPLGDAALYNNKVEQHPKFINGQIGMTQDWSGTLPKYKDVIGAENFAVGHSITVEGGVDSSTTYKPSMLLSVYSKSKYVDEAVKFTNWLLNDSEASLILNDCRSIPASASARQALIDNDVLDKDIMQMVENTLENPADPVPLIMNNSEIAEITKDICQKVVFGESTPEEAAEELISRVSEKLEALKAESN
ncbi:MAG: carbohydrate ABC transporter substrate-binding protein [Clostridiaceae bacterium]|nr:carbohydrate ABC transporter substrate-binding protein [Clostridiaceae bacterium]